MPSVYCNQIDIVVGSFNSLSSCVCWQFQSFFICFFALLWKNISLKIKDFLPWTTVSYVFFICLPRKVINIFFHFFFLSSVEVLLWFLKVFFFSEVHYYSNFRHCSQKWDEKWIWISFTRLAGFSCLNLRRDIKTHFFCCFLGFVIQWMKNYYFISSP